MLRFDGYYILMDWLELPNLGARANRYIGYLLQRYLFGLREARSPATTASERPWLTAFALASFAYRMFIMVFIIMLVASQYFFVGVVLAMWAGYSGLLLPLSRQTGKLLFDDSIAPRRGRAIAVSTAAVVALGALLFFLPLPYRTTAEGIVWIPEQTHVRAGSHGFVDEVLAMPGAAVAAGEPLVRTSDPALAARTRMLAAQVDELQARYDAAVTIDRVMSNTLGEELELAREKLSDARDREADLVITSPLDGIFVPVDPVEDLPGRFLRRGALVAYVIDEEGPTVRVVVPQHAVDLVRQRTGQVEVRLADNVHQSIPARVRREVPGASEELPSIALTLAGGGEIATDPTAGEAQRATQALFQFELALQTTELPQRFGGRAYVRFAHGDETLARRWYRSGRQLLLKIFNV